MQHRLMVFSLALVACLAMTGLAFAQTCQDIHGATGCAPSPQEGNEVTLSGIVYVVPGTYNSGSMYWSCAGGTGGMTLFDSGLSVALGDEIEVTGTVDAFGSEIQLITTTVSVLTSGNPYTATPIGTADLADGSDLLGDFMSVQGVVTLVEAGFNSTLTVDDGSGPVICFVDGTTGIAPEDLDPFLGNIVKISGSTKCFNGEGEILPRGIDDLELITIPAVEKAWGALKADFR